MRFTVSAIFWLVLAAHAGAQGREAKVVAANGVEVSVWADEFSGRYEFAAPAIEAGDGFVFVSRVDETGVVGSVRLTGGFVYMGDWRYYNRALFRGGEEAEFIERGRDVGSCRARSGCSLNESFAVLVRASDLERYSRDGRIDVQVRAREAGAETVFSVPVSHFEAVQEVASRPRDTLVPPPYDKSMGPPRD